MDDESSEPSDETASRAPRSPRAGESFLRPALLFQSSLIPAAVIAGMVVGHAPLEFFAFSGQAALQGLAGTLPMLLFLAATAVLPFPPLRRLRALMDDSILPMFRGWSAWHLATLALLAGVGEEMLFRGVLQTAVGAWATPLVGLTVASLVFGLLHALTPTYAIMTTLMGAYLGWLYLATGNLLAPMIAHGLYDFIALIYLLRTRPEIATD